MLARPTPSRPTRTLGLGLAASALLLLATGAARHGVQDLRLDRATAEAPAALPATLAPQHPVVLARAARFEGRSAPFFDAALDRRAGWTPLVDGALADAGLPAWLAAVPLVESGYTNWGAPGAPKVGSTGCRWTRSATSACSRSARRRPRSPCCATCTGSSATGAWRSPPTTRARRPCAPPSPRAAPGTPGCWSRGGWLNAYSADVVAAARLMRAR